MSARRAVIALTAFGCCIALVACGSSGHSKGASHKGAFLAYSQCMRANGVTNFPDPGSGGGIQISSSSGINPFSPAFKAAQSHCSHLLPGGGPTGNGHPSASVLKQMVATSQCMRAHGVTRFPDPTTTPPSSPQGAGAIEGHDGVFLIIPSTINTGSPAFEQASRECGFGPGAGHGGKVKTL